MLLAIHSSFGAAYHKQAEPPPCVLLSYMVSMIYAYRGWRRELYSEVVCLYLK